MGHLKHLNQINAFYLLFFFPVFASIYRILYFLPLFASKPHLRHCNAIQNKTSCLHTDLSISLKPSGLQEYGNTALFPCCLRVFNELSVCWESGALQHLINLKPSWAASCCTHSGLEESVFIKVLIFHFTLALSGVYFM